MQKEVMLPFGKVDVTLLKQQKATLVEIQATRKDLGTKEHEALDGIINMLDELQDYCENPSGPVKELAQ